MVVRDFQSRLAMKHGIIQRKIIDNQIGLAANPTDCIRVKLEKNYLGDIDSRIIEAADIVPIIWPPLKDIPIRKIGQDGSGQYTITSMVAHAEEDNMKNFELYVPHKNDIDIDDYIIRVFNDPDVSQPIILVVKVTELLGTFNQEMLLWEKCICTPDNEALPDKILNVIGEMAKRRLHIKF